MRRGRYEIGGTWSPLTLDTVLDLWEEVGTVAVEVADVRDTRTGDNYRSGARRVTVKVRGGGKRSRVFVGEFAWADARRWSDDTVDALLRARLEGGAR